MSTGRQTVRDLVDEAKKRVVLLIMCTVGLSYLMSLTSSSVLVNLPAAASLILLLRYISFDLDVRRKAAAYNNKPAPNSRIAKKTQEVYKVLAVENSSWRIKVSSPVVEAAIDQFTRHLVSEWVTDLWYSRLTPDKDGPEELIHLINGVVGEVSCRVKDINIIDLFTRDIINLICTHLELYRMCVAKVEKLQSSELTFDNRDRELKLILAAENKLHPALFSADAEHKVLQHLMDGLISFTFNPADLHCSFFRLTVRELLACAVMRPVLNLASPRFINERIESLVLSIARRAEKGTNPPSSGALKKKSNVSRSSIDHFSGILDHSGNGVELVQFKNKHASSTLSDSLNKNANGAVHHKDPLLSLDPRSSHSLPETFQAGDRMDSHLHHSGGEWGKMLDAMSHRKTQALAPENFENMWTKGRDYEKASSNQSVIHAKQNLLDGSTLDHSNVVSVKGVKCESANFDFSKESAPVCQSDDRSTKASPYIHSSQGGSSHPSVTTCQEEHEQDLKLLENAESESDSSYTTDEEESTGVTGLDSPGTKVWDSKNKKNASVTYIRHPLESSEGQRAKKSGKGHAHCRKVPRTQLSRKRSRLGRERVPIWQEVERTSFLLGDGQDILNTPTSDVRVGESSDDPEWERWGRTHSGAAASSSIADVSASKVSKMGGPENSVLAHSFLRLRCEVLGANIVKSGPRTFAVYSISVKDANNNVWSIKRRFRHFEELHRRLKEFREYNLSLPPKHFLSSGLEVPVVQERSKLLDAYLKKLLQLPTLSGSIEVWDFLSVDSQTYTFSNSLSILQTLSVDLDGKPYERNAKSQNMDEAVKNPLSSWGDHIETKSRETVKQMDTNFIESNSRSNARKSLDPSTKIPGKDSEILFEDSGSDTEGGGQNSTFTIKKVKTPSKGDNSNDPQDTCHPHLDTAADPSFPTEWVPPNLSSPILDLVDVIFQLQDGGWIRRQAFWVAKQVLQLGMGDALDDWLIEKIQLLRRGSVIASAIKRVEQILWPDGIFLTKHPSRQRPPQTANQSPTSQSGGHSMSMSSQNKDDVQKRNGKDTNLLTDDQQKEAARRAKFVYELMIDKAPAALVSIFGRKEYERSAKDLYFFLQSSVCLKQLAFNLLELLLLSAFPELDDAVRQLDEEKHRFGKLETK
ncbi:hypothetical protein Scep_007585 [Stephania cephalantha]|uniref:Uncharacterized protein n=1 Tax=Stephania cephalantha TaxID=152367 RepID=A0AAP0KA48_9MAGN